MPSQHASPLPLMDRTPSKAKAALWMAGWLSLMLVVVVAGREASRELNVFQILELRAGLGLLMLYPLIHLSGSLDSPIRRLCDIEDMAAVRSCGAQSHSLRRPTRLVLRADTDSNRAGGGDRIHDADLDRHPGGEFSRRTHDDLEDLGDCARSGRCRRHRSPRDRGDQSGSTDRACRSRGIWYLRRHDEIADADRNGGRDCLLDAGDPVHGRPLPFALRLEMAFAICLVLGRCDCL